MIISCSGTIGRVAIVPKTAEPGIINQALLKLTVNSDIILPEFFKMAFESNATQKQIGALSMGAALQNVASVSFLKEMQLPVPTIEQQRQVVERFAEQRGHLSELLSALSEQLTRVNQLPTALLRDAFSGAL